LSLRNNKQKAQIFCFEDDLYPFYFFQYLYPFINQDVKRVSSFIVTVLLLLAFGISGLLYVFYDAAQYIDKAEAQKSITADAQIQVIRLSLKEFSSLKETDEIWAGGKLYDISSYTIENDSVEIRVYHDEKEESLINCIAASFEPFSSCTSENNCHHFAKHHIHPPADAKILATPYCINFRSIGNTRQVISRFLEYPSFIYTAIIKPPPRMC
jgi:hypothetical protein